MRRNVQYQRATGKLTVGDAAEVEKFRTYLRDSESMSPADLLAKHWAYMGFEAMPLPQPPKETSK